MLIYYKLDYQNTNLYLIQNNQKNNFQQMMIKNHLKNGQLYQLNSSTSPKQQHIKSVNQLQSFDEQYSEQEIQKIRQRELQKKIQQMKQNTIAMICGLAFCFITTIIGGWVFIHFIYPLLTQYLPFLRPAEIPELILTELTAKQYLSKFPIYAGQIHYARIPIEYWEHRIQMVKSMGLNALSVYIFWNYHQIQKGKFDFQTGNKNLTRFLQLAQKYQLRVLIRPGPYVCAEWDFGGLPARLLSINDLKIRSSNKFFIDQSQIYLTQVNRIISPFIKSQSNFKGPIVLLQIQNEPGFFTQEKLYIDKLKQIWNKINPAVTLYFDDTQTHLNYNQMYWGNAILAMNSKFYQKGNFQPLSSKYSVFAGQVYAGWFTSWGSKTYSSKHSMKFINGFINQFSDLLSENKSFSMYMVHGGTNFGLTAGYNIITSYDYFAPINQQGLASNQYHKFRSIFTNFSNISLPTIPLQIGQMDMKLESPIILSSLFQNLPKGQQFKGSTNPLIFQSQQLKMFNQGFVLYQTTLDGPGNYKFQVKMHDLAMIYVDDKFVSTIQRDLSPQVDLTQQLVVNCKLKLCKLQILVEAMGHVGFGTQMINDTKGILLFKQIIQDTNSPAIKQSKWKYYKFDVRNQPNWKNTGKCNVSPCLHYLQAKLKSTADTYFQLNGFQKGYVWVNGHNLGRYWNIGPQDRLYCPGVWLNQGKNKIIILDLFVNDTIANSNLTITGKKYLYQN